MDPRRQFGNDAEKHADAFLRSKGMRVLASQYKKIFGEIDLICQDGDEIVFVEVKARHSNEFGYPEEAVTPEKITHIVRVGQAFLREHKWTGLPWRVDVVALEYDHEPPKITHLQNIDIPDGFW